MTTARWALDDEQRATLAAALDALLPAEGSFPWPSHTGMIDEFILRRVPPAGSGWVPYPGLDAQGLRELLAALAGRPDMTAALQQAEQEQPELFVAFWRLAVYGYYSRPEVIAAVAREHAPAYHGAPLPLGYAHVIPPWDAADPLQLPRHPRGTVQRTDEVRPVDLSALPLEDA